MTSEEESQPSPKELPSDLPTGIPEPTDPHPADPPGRSHSAAGLFLLIVFALAFVAVPGSDGWAGAGSRGSWLDTEHQLLSASTWFQAAVDRPGGDPDARVRLGDVLLRRGQAGDAVSTLKLALVGGATSPEVFRDLAAAQKQAGDLAASLDTLQRELALHPGDAATWARLVREAAQGGLRPSEIRRRLGSVPAPPAGGATGQEVAYLQGACVLGPESNMGSRALIRAEAGPDAHILAAARDLSDAASMADEAARPLAIANALLDQGLDGPAIAYLQDQQQGAREAQRLALLGYAMSRRGDPGQAEQLLRRSLQVDPNLHAAEVLLGSVLLAKGQAEQAIPLLDKAAREKPPDPGAYVELANALVDIGDYGTAEQALGLAIQADPENGDLRLAVATFYVSRQYRVEKALPEAEEAVRLLGRTPSTLGTLGWALHLSGRSADALEPLTEAVTLDPESALLRYRLGSVYEGLGQRDNARRQYMMVQELDGGGEVWKRAQAALDGL